MPIPNPFDEIDQRLTCIEQSIAELKSKIDLIIKQLPDQGSELMTAKQVAKFLNLAVQTVYGLVNRGEIPHMKRNGKLYFDKSEILDYIRKGRRKTHEEIQEELENLILKGKRKK